MAEGGAAMAERGLPWLREGSGVATPDAALLQ